MSFKTFIYYCALSGGWAAFLAWAFLHATGLGGKQPAEWLKNNELLRACFTGAVLGLLVAAAVGAMDALLNAVGLQRVTRVLVALGVGMVGGLLGALAGGLLYQVSGWFRVFGWMLTGACIGASIGVFDWLRAIQAKEDTGMAFKKVLNGVIGGLLGGLIGGLPFSALYSIDRLGRSSLTIGLVLLGLSIGLMIGLAQVFLKEAWIKIEAGFRAGREVMLGKEVTTIGRAESCDIGLFRDNTIERSHAKILLQNNRYLLEDENTPAGTFLNNERVGKPTPLKNGDLIRVGSCELRFGERQKRS
jgi:Inner membrane component of T3SS, cytoplasmic domain